MNAHRWGLGAFVIVEAAYLLTSAAFGVLAPAGPPPAWLITLAIGVPTLVAAALAVAIASWRGNGARIDFRWQWSWRAVGLGLAFGIGGLFVTLPAALVYQAIVGPDATSAVGGVFEGVRTGWPMAVTVLLLVAVVAPICEEVVFRGLLWGALEQRWGRVTAAIVSTLVFALAHLELQGPAATGGGDPNCPGATVFRQFVGRHHRPSGDQSAAGHHHDVRPAGDGAGPLTRQRLRSRTLYVEGHDMRDSSPTNGVPDPPTRTS